MRGTFLYLLSSVTSGEAASALFLVVEAGLRAARRVLAFRSMDGKFEGRLECQFGAFRSSGASSPSVALSQSNGGAQSAGVFSWHRGRPMFARKQSRRGFKKKRGGTVPATSLGMKKLN